MEAPNPEVENVRARKALIGAVASLALVAGACGGGDEDTTTTEPAEQPTTLAETEAPEALATPQTPEASTEPEAPETPADPETPDTPAEPEAPEVPDALDFDAAAVGGGTVDVRELAGKPVVFWFWAPWCPQCQREASLVADLAEQYAGEVEFVGVAGLTGDLGSIEDFVADRGVDGFDHIDDRDGAVYSRFEVTQQYDLGLVTADGEVDVLRGPLSEDDITGAVADLAGA